MPLEPWHLGAAVAVAFFAGALDAMAGGGGLLTLPMAASFPGMDIPHAMGTNKLVGTCGSTTSTIRFLAGGKINRGVALWGGTFAGAGAVLGALSIAWLGKGDDRAARLVVGILLVVAALYLFFRPRLGGTNEYAGPTARNRTLLALAALGIGFYDGFFGPGTGSILAFVMVRFLRFDFVTGTGNAKALNFASNVTALGTFLARGLVVWPVAIPMGIANAAGSWVGSTIAMRRGAGFVRWVYLAVAVAIAARLAHMVLSR